MAYFACLSFPPAHVSIFLLVIISTFIFGDVARATLVCHDDSFTPDAVLRISSADISVACAHRETVVVNGTSPGPVVRLTEGKTSWIRVYNDMGSNNLTMVYYYTCTSCEFVVR
jgi:hypothetical protein